MKPLAVSELVNYLKYEIDTNDSLQNILVMGEISNFKHHSSGHLYFSLKDDNARINCVMFRFNANKLLFEPKSGDQVLIKAKASIYVDSGQLQLYVSEMKLDGIGDLYLKYEALKNKLKEQGYFDVNHKIAPPKFPMRVAVLVGDNSAALSDIRTTFARRWPIAKYDVYPVLVQGPGSSEDIIKNLVKVDGLDYDAIILARGGGSIEDLWSFNDENLAKTIYNLKTFIVTGVGHEQDFTIADFVADLRAATPTASVEVITPKLEDVQLQISELSKRAVQAVQHKYEENTLKVNQLLNSQIFLNKFFILEKDSQKLDNLLTHLLNYRNVLTSMHKTIDSNMQSLLFNVSRLIQFKCGEIDKLNLNLINYSKQLLMVKQNLVKRQLILLNAYGYENTLQRGYSLVFKNNQIIKNCEDLFIHDLIDIKLSQGNIVAEVKEIKNGEGKI